MSRKRAVVPPVLVAAVLLTGCDQTAWLDEVGRPAMPTDAPGLAAFLREGTASIRTAHLELTVRAGGQSLRGHGDETLRDGRATAFDLTETVPGAGDVRVVTADGRTYVRLPAGLDPSDKPWLLVSEDSSDPLVQQLAASLSSVTRSSSLDQYTAFARAARVQVAGTERVDGADATHYRLSVDVTKLPNDTPGRADILSAGIVHLPVELWVDERGRPVKVGEDLVVQGQTVDTVVTLGDFDRPVSIAAPPADQVATG